MQQPQISGFFGWPEGPVGGPEGGPLGGPDGGPLGGPEGGPLGGPEGGPDGGPVGGPDGGPLVVGQKDADPEWTTWRPDGGPLVPEGGPWRTWWTLLMEAHLVDQKVGHSVDLMEVQKGRVVTKAALLLSERLVLLGPVQVVQLVVEKGAMEQAQFVPE